MFGDIARFLLNTIFTLFGAALLLRAWLQFVRMPPYNPVSNAVLQITNWIVLPLRKLIPGRHSIDWASLIAALIAAFVYVLLMVWSVGVDPLQLLPTLVIVALLTLVKWALNLIIWLTILTALLSWLNPNSPAMPILLQLTAPFLNPLRRMLPKLGGLDLSPIVLFVIVEILLRIVERFAMQLTFFGI